MTAMDFHVRAAEEDDRRRLALLFAAVAEERDGIAAEPPVDIEKRAASWDVERILVAVTGRDPVGLIFVHESPFGFGDIGMLVAAEWRGRGVGTALVAAAIEWARARGLHKLTLDVFPHNDAAIVLYRKFGFVEEGRRVKHIRRANGDLWDVISMGLPL
jgi:RimJ/RimL family protein N-acetyltransferase